MGEGWTLEAVQYLRRLVAEGAPVSVIAMAMRRGAGEIHEKIADLGLSPSMEGHEDGEVSSHSGTEAFAMSEPGAVPEAPSGQTSPPQPEPGSASF